MHSILFVCLANICRSPAAEAVFTYHVTKKGLIDHFHIESCAISGWSIGEAADSRMQAAALKRGIEITGRASTFHPSFYQTFDWILAADQSVMDSLIHQAPNEEARNKIILFTYFSKIYSGQDIPDPYYLGAEGFERVLDMIDDSSVALLDYLIKKQ
jgi:protein-tyrosine phosphatase